MNNPTAIFFGVLLFTMGFGAIYLIWQQIKDWKDEDVLFGKYKHRKKELKKLYNNQRESE